MSFLALFFGICAIALLATTNYHRNRAANLEIHNCDLREQLADAHAKLDDAQRNATYWQKRHSSLLCENNTLLVDLTHVEQRNQYLESLHSHRKGEVAGVRLVSGCAGAKLTVAKELP